MKKLAFLFAAVVAVSFASCGNKAAQTEACADSYAVDTCCVEEVVDSCCGDSCCQADTVAAPVAE